MTEREISRDIQGLFRLVGFHVFSTEQGYRRDPGGTRMTPGIPDLWVMGHGMALWIEVKTPKGKLRDSQMAFRACCFANGVDYQLMRSIADAKEWLWENGILENPDA